LVVEGDETVNCSNLLLEAKDYPTLLGIDLVPMHQAVGAFGERVKRDGKVLYVAD
jgi:hypothetical protein